MGAIDQTTPLFSPGRSVYLQPVTPIDRMSKLAGSHDHCLLWDEYEDLIVPE